jgi:hypothetical protein
MNKQPATSGYAVTFKKCGGDYAEWSATVRVAQRDDDEGPRAFDARILDRAAAKIFGKGCEFFSDSGLGPLYGQVVRPGGDTATCRVHAEIVPRCFQP